MSKSLNSINVITPSKSTKVRDMKIGDIGRIVNHNNGDYNDLIVLMTYSGLISLSNPNRTWCINPENPYDIDVEIFPVGSEITIKVRGA